MGYRTYIGSMPKREYNKVKSLPTVDEVHAYFNAKGIGDRDYVGVYKMAPPIYEFGKYTNFQPPKGSQKSFFKKAAVKERYEEHDFHVVTKEFLAYIIETYRIKVAAYYQELLSGVDRNDKQTWTEDKFAVLYEHAASYDSEWNYLTPYNLDSGEAITTSWKYEYGIFELVRIYKSFDWKRNVMVYYGF